jgi:hypothetical protein
MNRLRLLATTKSLVGLNESEPHYRVTRERLVPQFGPSRNPFRATDTSAPGRPESSNPIEHSSALSPAPGQLNQSPVRTQVSTEGIVAPKLATGLSVPTSKKGVRSWATAFWAGWTQKLGVTFSRPARKPSRVALPSTPKLPVQGELSLDRIKVVRNDLSDADLEIVPLKSATARPGATPVLPIAQRTAQGEMSWSRLSELFGASRR